MGVNDAREQLEVCKQVNLKMDGLVQEALDTLDNIHIGAPEAIRRARALLEEALR